jgi:rod shape-determining protein MreC
MSASYAQQKAPWLLGVLLLAQFILMSWTARHPDTDQSLLRTWVMSGVALAVKGGDKVVSGAGGLVKGYVALRGAREENTYLKQQVEQLTEERDEAREKAAEDARLRAEYSVALLPEYRKVNATVISRNPSTWFNRLIIDQGSASGVKLNLPVIAASGIVGRITAVGPFFAEVQVITDRHAGLGAMLQRNRAMGEVRGLDESRCELKDVSTSVDVQPSETIVTTGLDGIYPKGIVVGTVESVQDDPNAPWHKIIVKPTAPIDRLENVQVLLVEPKDIKMTETIK